VPDPDPGEALVGGGALRRLDRAPMDFIADDGGGLESAHARQLSMQIEQQQQFMNDREMILRRNQNLTPAMKTQLLNEMATARREISRLRSERLQIQRKQKLIQRGP
jgi:hypothetical protein